MPKLKSKSPSFFGGEYTLRVIGFTADVIAIVTVIFAIKSDAIAKFLPFMISSWVLLPIWIISLYTYFCWLHYYWEKTKDVNGWCDRFSIFFIGEMIIRLKKPVTLLPLLILIIAAIWILETTKTWLLTIPLVVFAFIYLLTALASGGQAFRHKYFVSANAPDKEFVEKNWNEFARLIQTKSADFHWITAERMNDAMVAWEIDESTILYAFAKCAAERPEKFHYGTVRDRFRNIVAYKALIILENFDYENLRF